MASTEGSIKQAADLAIKAHAAAQVWAEATQADVDRVTQAMADAGHEAAAHLAEMAHAETGYGRVDHKTFKNIFCTRRYLDQIRHIPTVGVIASYPERGVTEIAEPVGVVAGLVPVTNPTSTTLFYGIACVRSRNAVVNAAHPRAVKTIAETARILDEAATGRRRAAEPDHGHDRGVARGHAGADGALPHRPRAGHRLAADGARRILVRQADLRGRARQLAGLGAPLVRRPGRGRCRDPGVEDVRQRHRVRVGAGRHRLHDDRRPAARGVHAPVAPTSAPMQNRSNSRSCCSRAARARRSTSRSSASSPPASPRWPGLSVPAGTRALVVRPAGVGRDHALSHELLCPVLKWYPVATEDEGLATATALLKYGGDGHTAAIWAEDPGDRRALQPRARLPDPASTARRCSARWASRPASCRRSRSAPAPSAAPSRPTTSARTT